MKNCPTKQAVLGHLRDILIVIIIGNVISFLFYPVFTNMWERFWLGSAYSVFIGITLWKGNQYIGWLIHKKINVYKEPQKALRWNLITMFLYSMTAILIVNYTWFVLIFEWPVEKLFSRGLLTMLIEFIITVVITSIYFSIGFFRAWRESALNEERLEKESIRLQYNALKNQVNPHFLFNSLNTLTTLVYKDPDQSARFIKQLAEVYRYVLEHKDSELVTLDEEIGFCDKYIYLQKIRHGENLEVVIRIPKNEPVMVVPLSIQLLLENAIKHNEISDENHLLIEISIFNNYLEVSNNLQPRKSMPDSGGIGLETLRKRYGYLTDHELHIRNDSGRFTVSVPLIKTDKS